MSLVAGTRLGPYEITAQIGVGGMGEVYRATDTNLKRAVAIKVLPGTVASDAERLARFQREAEVLASLNHPNIASIYGLERADGATALVMELVEGETLADRIALGPLPLDDALPIAQQIAEALGAAHEQGIVHRDLKPANIKVRPDGTVKVLDFGLAKAMEPAGSLSPNVSQSPTITTPAHLRQGYGEAGTELGVILGTAAYMSPEQARGRAVDRRADIWAFGCVLYEMLTGRRAFDGEDLTITIAAVVRGEPDWSALPADVPPQIGLLMKRCLEKDPSARIGDIAVARFLMAETNAPATSGLTGDSAYVLKATVAAEKEAAVTDVRRELTASARRRTVVSSAFTLIAGVALASMVWWMVMRPATPPAPRLVRFAITAPLVNGDSERDVAISPDGSQIVYRARTGGPGGGQLVVRPISELEPRPLEGTAGARAPFFSPDGLSVGFFTQSARGGGGEIKTVPIAGGSPMTVARYQGFLRGASWGTDERIVFATTDLTTGLLAVRSGGGEPTVLTKPDSGAGELDHTNPFVLPGAQAVLFTVVKSASTTVAVLDVKTGQHKPLMPGGNARYVDTGHVLYQAGGFLQAVGFDPRTLTVTSDPVPVPTRINLGASIGAITGAADFDVSRNGTLVYVPEGASGQSDPRSLVWVTRQGREEPLPEAQPRAYVLPRLSPDGTRIALDVRDRQNDIWIFDLKRHTFERLTTDPESDRNPVWTHDGTRIVFASSRTGSLSLYWQRADGTGAVEPLGTGTGFMVPTSVSPDGTGVALMQNLDIAFLTFDKPTTPSGNANARRTELLLQSDFREDNPEISPDGHFLAYESDESGQLEVYVRPFPKVNDRRWPISTSGGRKPAWAPKGRELFYLDGNDLLTAVPVQTGASFSAGTPVKLLSTAYYAGGGNRTYDVSPDGQRFLMIKENPQPVSTSTPTPPTIVVVLNWIEELKRLVPTK